MSFRPNDVNNMKLLNLIALIILWLSSTLIAENQYGLIVFSNVGGGAIVGQKFGTVNTTTYSFSISCTSDQIDLTIQKPDFGEFSNWTSNCSGLPISDDTDDDADHYSISFNLTASGCDITTLVIENSHVAVGLYFENNTYHISCNNDRFTATFNLGEVTSNEVVHTSHRVEFDIKEFEDASCMMYRSA